MHPYRKMIDMPKEILHTMGKRLKMLRDNAEMDQRQFAHAVSRRGVSVTNSFVSKMESGDSKPSIDVLVAIADELAVSADYLLMRTNIPDTAESILAEIERQQGGVDDTGRGVTEEAAAAANIIDTIPDARLRGRVLEFVQLAAMHARRDLEAATPPPAAAPNSLTKLAEEWIDSIEGKTKPPPMRCASAAAVPPCWPKWRPAAPPCSQRRTPPLLTPGCAGGCGCSWLTTR